VSECRHHHFSSFSVLTTANSSSVIYWLKSEETSRIYLETGKKIDYSTYLCLFINKGIGWHTQSPAKSSNSLLVLLLLGVCCVGRAGVGAICSLLEFELHLFWFILEK
jgi:hypothetical protein